MDNRSTSPFPSLTRKMFSGSLVRDVVRSTVEKMFGSVARAKGSIGCESESFTMRMKRDMNDVAGAIILNYLIGSREAIVCDSTQT